MTDIVTKRLIIKPLISPSLTVLRTLVGWLNDPEIVRYSEQRHRVHNAATELGYIDSFQFPDQLKLVMLGDDPIGTITVFIDASNSIAEMGILIGAKDIWGMGYGAEAWAGTMDHLFVSGVRKIEAGCMATNDAMLGIFMKTHMIREGMRERHFILDGKEIDMEQWARFKDG